MVSTSQEFSRPPGLSTGHFRRIAANGFGDPHNSYAYGYAWYRDHLFVGTNRDILVLARKRFRFEVPTSVWPVEVPEDVTDLDLSGQIWRYNPRTDEWKRVYRSPMVPGLENMTVPLGSGFRNMAVFQARSDTEPALYTIPSCGSFGVGPVMLRCGDGEDFEQITEQGMGLGDPNITSVRSMVVFKGRLFMTPAGSRGFDPNVSYHARILCTEDPSTGKWEAVNETCFGDPTNYGIYDMCVCGNHLYAGTMNIRDGCQLWKTDGEGRPPFRWTKVFDRGADRGLYNQGVVSVAAFGENVYLGTGIQNGGYDRVNNIGPDAGEVIRVYPDDTWDLVVGQPRTTRYGLKSPTSGLGPGFDNRFAGYIWRMAQHDGAFYVGTFDSTSMLPFAKLDDDAKRIFDPATMEQFLAQRGGCELWRTVDGNDWVPVTRNGFGNPCNWGIRTIVSSPYGLFVGTANPFGPNIAVQGPSGWRFEYNPGGGVEVWHGAHDHAGPQVDVDDRLPLSILSAGAEDGTGSQPDAVLSLPELNSDVMPSLDVALPTADNILSSLCDEAFAQELPDKPRHSIGSWKHRPKNTTQLDPLYALAHSEPHSGGADRELNRELSEYYRGTKMRSAGYWRTKSTTPAEACQSIVRELVCLLPEEQTQAGGNLLIVGQGSADIAKELANQCPHMSTTTLPNLVTELGISKKRSRRKNVDGGNGKAPALARFDVIVWLEGPLADQQGRALRKIIALLAPGGYLVAADLIDSPNQGDVEPNTYSRKEILDKYTKQLAAAGLVDVDTFDITRLGWTKFCKHSRLYLAARFLHHQIDADRFRAIAEALPGGPLTVAAHILVRARRRPQRKTRVDNKHEQTIQPSND